MLWGKVNLADKMSDIHSGVSNYMIQSSKIRLNIILEFLLSSMYKQLFASISGKCNFLINIFFILYCTYSN